MDLIPKPDQVVSAASNVAHKMLYGGVADLRKMPRTLIDEGLLRQVYHYRPSGKVKEDGDPVLLVTPLAAPSICFDLRRGCSLVEHLVTGGRPTYLVEYGEVSFRDRNLGMEHWIDEVVPMAIRAASEHAGGRPVHVIGWSLGGIFMTLAAADDPTLPIASMTIVGSPFDVAKVPLMAPLRPLVKMADRPWLGGLTDGRGPVTRVYQAMGGAPKPLVRWAFQLSAAQKLVSKPLVKLQNLDDTDFLAQIEAVEVFTANMIAYPGRTFGQLYHRFFKTNDLKYGYFAFGDRRIEIKDVDKPVLVFGGATDGIAPVACVKAVVPLLTGSPEVRFEVVPGGHLGMLTGRSARETTWKFIDGWISKWSSDREPEEASPPDKAPARKPAAKKAKPGASEAAGIGASPTRRYGSGSSRSLAK
ncbi:MULTISPECIES: alpha/beta fold hydrolase [unclassified Nocardioides]|uniref:alpha/beta fold hydrolase n=1 Tax=unclassified Nocardioides TaxID=2615069 RepID=UPI0006FB6BC5|nr:MULTISPECIES: alpha/beta fold hydrolase [unclassified Nocardioides]KQY55411.1 alpha/beta hydrolase [Nocardioides sp. Root140]KQZ75481.1 alpha/beta hydrolase [Nocardioides sp. Root151]KRF14557.1 alpha/beta hydrolase [Nocardioides sp. Soil796]